jgi:hypothetical protein
MNSPKILGRSRKLVEDRVELRLEKLFSILVKTIESIKDKEMQKSGSADASQKRSHGFLHNKRFSVTSSNDEIVNVSDWDRCNYLDIMKVEQIITKYVESISKSTAEEKRKELKALLPSARYSAAYSHTPITKKSPSPEKLITQKYPIKVSPPTKGSYRISPQKTLPRGSPLKLPNTPSGSSHGSFSDQSSRYDKYRSILPSSRYKKTEVKSSLLNFYSRKFIPLTALLSLLPSTFATPTTSSSSSEKPTSSVHSDFPLNPPVWSAVVILFYYQ